MGGQSNVCLTEPAVDRVPCRGPRRLTGMLGSAAENGVILMSRVRSFAGREAGVIAATIQGLFRLMFGRALNPIKVQAHSSRILLSSFLSNAILGSGRWGV